MKVFVIFVSALLMSCATSMTPIELSKNLPNMTKSKYVVSNAKAKNCLILSTSRKYNAPIGFTVKHDLKNGARGIDEWVELDKGNAYRLVNYQWVQVDDLGSTQLQIEFDTLKCHEEKN